MASFISLWTMIHLNNFKTSKQNKAFILPAVSVSFKNKQQQKLMQDCKAIILQLKRANRFTKTIHTTPKQKLTYSSGPEFFFYIYFLKFIFNCRIIALQCSVGFCHASTWISHMYTHVCLASFAQYYVAWNYGGFFFSFLCMNSSQFLYSFVSGHLAWFPIKIMLLTHSTWLLVNVSTPLCGIYIQECWILGHT